MGGDKPRSGKEVQDTKNLHTEYPGFAMMAKKKKEKEKKNPLESYKHWLGLRKAKVCVGQSTSDLLS